MSIECYKSECKWHEKNEPFCLQNECQECPNCGTLDFITEPVVVNEISIVRCNFCSIELRVYVRQLRYLTMVDQMFKSHE